MSSSVSLESLIATAGVGELVRGDGTLAVSELTHDSREVRPGTLFLCVPGSAHDGHDFAAAAIEAGAVALLVERELELEAPQVLVPDARAAMAPYAAAFFGDPSAELRVVGITGTNGKTTTAFLVRHLLEAAGERTGLLGTVVGVIGGVEQEVVRTTPEAVELQRSFRAMLDAGDRACVIEVSSHALALGRADAISFAVGAFTNLSQDHLDFHAEMEDYFAAKRELLLGPRPPRIGVVNVDDPWGTRLAAEAAAGGLEVVRCSTAGAEAEVRAGAISFNASGSSFHATGPGWQVEVGAPLPGRFNVANALLALAIVDALGVDPADAAAALASAAPVPGRFEPIDEGQPFAVLVDYAHTPDSLVSVLDAARALTARRLITVFGCGGDRDRDKRPKMGRAASAASDLAIVTSDNPRSEDPGAIIEEILAGIEAGAAKVEPDRRAAISRALAAAGEGDTVVIAGKGHEQGQELADETIPFDDRDVAREELRRLGAPA